MDCKVKCFRSSSPDYQGRLLLYMFFLLLVFILPFVDIEYLIIFVFLMLLLTRSNMDIKLFSIPISSIFNRGFNACFIFSSLILLFISYVLEQFSFSYPSYVAGQSIAISAVGLGCAMAVRCLNGTDVSDLSLKGNNNDFCCLSSSTAFVLSGILISFIAGSWIVYHEGASVSVNMIFFISVIGSITAALFESIPSKIYDSISVPLGSGMAMWVFSSFGYSVPVLQITIALIFAFFLSYLAYRARIADVSASFSAILMGVLIIVFTNILWFILLVSFFILGGMFTKYKYAYKESLGLAQSRGGVRTYENVFSNSSAALVLAISYGIYPEYSDLIIYAYLGTVATAAGDTLASEIGTTSGSIPRLITTFKPVSTGIDGGVTFLGEMAAIAGSFIIAILALVFGMVDGFFVVITVTLLGGFLGTNIDSLLGATLQNRGLLSNSGVNFVATFAGAMVSGVVYVLLS